MLRGILLGHSFVSGFKEYLNNCKPAVSEAKEVAKWLRISDHVSELHTYGIRGSNTKTFEVPRDYLASCQPHFAIVELGTNDVGRPSMREAAEGVISIAKQIRSLGVFHVYICGVTVRQDKSNYRTSTKIEDINNWLYKFCQKEHGFHFYRHRGVERNNLRQLSNDGLHLNTARGREVYKKSIRRVCFQAVERIHQSKVGTLERIKVRNLLNLYILTLL